MQAFPPWASSLSFGLHPLVSDTHRQCIRQTPAARVQTLYMHTDEPINRPFIPMTYYTLMSDRMWEDCSNNISFGPSLRNVYTSTAHALIKKNTSRYFSYVWCITQIYLLLSPLSVLDMMHLYSVCQHFRGKKNIAFGCFMTQFPISVKADHWHTQVKCKSNLSLSL